VVLLEFRFGQSGSPPMSVAKLEGYASAQAITGRFALRVEVSLQVGNAVHCAVHRLKVDLQHTAVAREEAPGPVLALDPGVQDVADRRVADQRGLRVVRAGIIEQYARRYLLARRTGKRPGRTIKCRREDLRRPRCPAPQRDAARQGPRRRPALRTRRRSCRQS